MAETKKQARRARRSAGWQIIKFIETFAILPSGPKAGERVKLMQWQKRWILELFELDGNGRRKHRWAFLTAAKKSSKTALISFIALALLVADPTTPAPVIAVCASTDDQADILFGDCAYIARNGPLKDLLEVFDREIRVKGKPGAVLKRVSSQTGESLDGLRCSAVLFDELHTFTGAKHREVWNRLVGSTAAEDQPMVIQITTAGSADDTTIYHEQEDYARRVLTGEVDDPAYFPKFFEAPEGSDPLDEEALKAANPSLGVTVSMDFYRDQVTKRTASDYARYFLNQRQTTLDEVWSVADTWDEQADPHRELDPALPLSVGIDASLRGDSTAVVLAQRQDEDVVLRATIFENPHRKGSPQHAEWRMDLGQVEDFLRGVFHEFPVSARSVDRVPQPGPIFGFDAAFFSRSAEILEDDGLLMVEHPQTDSRMVPASARFAQMVSEGRIWHDGDPGFRRQIRSVVPHDKPPRGWRASKPRGSRLKIDAAIAAIIATWYATEKLNVEEIHEPVFIDPDDLDIDWEETEEETYV